MQVLCWVQEVCDLGPRGETKTPAGVRGLSSGHVFVKGRSTSHAGCMATRAREDQWERNEERATAPGSYVQTRLMSAGPPVVFGKDTAMAAAHVQHSGG